MQDAKPPSTRRGKGQPAKQANAGLKQRAAAAKRPSGRTRTGFLESVLAEAAKAPAQAARAATPNPDGKPATRKQIARAGDRAAERFRRTQALKSYTSASRADRSRMVAAAEGRAAKGKASDHDRLVLDTHYRRAAQSVGRDTEVAAANRAHDAAVAGRQAKEAVDSLISRFAESRFTVAQPKKSGLSSVLDSIVGDGASELVSKGSRTALDGAGDAVSAVGDLRSVLQRRNGSPLEKQALRAGGPDDVIVAGARTAGNTLRAASEDPAGVAAKTAKGIAQSIPDAIAGVPQMLQNPAGALKGVADDYSDRYGWATNPNRERREEGAKAQRERIKKEGAAAEVLDAAMVGPGASTTAARAVSRVGRAGKEGSKLRKFADFVDAPRPDLAIGDGKSVKQRKSSGLVGVAGQRALDAKRAGRVRRQSAAKGEKQAFGTGGGSLSKREQREANQRQRQDFGRGVRGVKPKAGQVAHLSAGWRGPLDRQAASQRKQLSKITGTASRRVNRAADDHARPAEAAMARLRPEEQRAARAAVEGWISVKDPKVALEQVESAMRRITTERAKLRASPKKAAEYAGLIGDQTDNLRSLNQLAVDLRDRPGKVLTARLREFVEDDRSRRVEFEDVAADVLDRTTMKRRRVDPAAVHFGTYEQHALERRALDRLREAGGDAQKASERIAAKRQKASATTRAGKAKRRQLGQELRAVDRIAGEFGRTLSGDDLARAEAQLVDRHYDRTLQAARASGVEDFDPGFFGHRRTDSGGLAEFTAGAGGKGKVAGFKRSEMRLHRLGFVDETPGGFAIGKQQAAKRAAQWQLVDEVGADFVPTWARGADGKGITRKQFESAVREQGLDPQDWALWQSKASLDDNGRGNVGDSELGLTIAEVNKMGAHAPAWTRGRFHVIPRNVLDDMNQQSGRAARFFQAVSGGSSGAILGSNPFYAVRQTLQTAPLTLMHTKLGFVDPVVWRNFRALRRAEKDNPRVMRDLHDRFGTRSRMKDFTESPRMGSLARDEKRWAAGLNYDQRVLFGVDFKRLLEERRSPGPAGTASVAARTAAKRNPASLVFRASKDFNILVDAWQDRLQRTFALAYEDAKLGREGVRQDFPQIAAKDAGELARKLGPVAAAAQLPWHEYKALERSPEFRHAVEEAGDQLTKFLGDYANYSKFEQRYARSIFMFYGFVRHSARLLLTVLPLEHPVMFAAMLQNARLSQEQKQGLLDQAEKQHVLPPEMMRGLFVLSVGDKLKTIDTKWLNPFLGPMQELASNGLAGQLPIATPFIALLEARTGRSDFTGNPVTNRKGAAVYDNKLSELDRGRLIANRLMSMLYPVRIADEVINGDKGKLADTSIPVLDPQPVEYKPGGEYDKRNKQRIAHARDRGAFLRALEAGVPLFPKDGQKLLDAARYETGKAAPPQKRGRRAPASGSGWGGGSGRGGSSWGGGSY